MSPPRVRFAPSPTGYLHVGNVRTALFDWLFARNTGGTCLLRIEDTDESRNNPEWVDLIYRSLEWLGLGWDGEPTFQSHRFDSHRETALQLFERGLAYYCDCTKDDVDRRTAERAASGGDKTPGYDSFCADRGLAAGEGRALRFRVPDDGVIDRRDVIYGSTDIALSTVEDFVILRANGVPLYAFANALDDIEDGITHVLRGEDHLNNVAKQILLRRALGAAEPTWAHLPMIVAPDGRRKLSKRRDKVALESFRHDGYLPEAMVNYLATLGWMPASDSPDEPEIASLPSMVASFRLEDVSSSGARFDEQKLAAFNGLYLRKLPADDFVRRAGEFFADAGVLETMAPHVQTRVQRLDELGAMLDFFVEGPTPATDPPSWDKLVRNELAPAVLGRMSDALGALAKWDADSLKAAIEAVGAGMDPPLTLRKSQEPVRIAVTGRTVGPPLFESLEVLGRDETLVRLRDALARLG